MPRGGQSSSQRVYHSRTWNVAIAISFCSILWLLYASRVPPTPTIFDLPDHHECGPEIPTKRVAIIGEQGQTGAALVDAVIKLSATLLQVLVLQGPRPPTTSIVMRGHV